MKHILLVLGQYLPNPSANGLCCEKISSELKKIGYDVSFVVNSDITVSTHEDGYYRVPKLLYQELAEKAKSKSGTIIGKIYHLFSWIIDRARIVCFSPIFPVSSPFHLKRYISMIAKAVEENKVDLIIGVNLPVDSVFAAATYKKTHKKMKFVGYFLDPLAGGANNSFLGDVRSFKKSMIIEKKIINAADAVIVQKEHKKHYEEYYEEADRKKIYFYGAPLLCEQKNCFTRKEKDIIVYAGALSKTTRNPQYIIDAFKYVNSASLVMYVTNGYEWVRSMAEGNQNVKVYPGVSHEEIIRIMEEATAFLNIGNTQSMFAPSKVIEYIGFGKPIISTYRVDYDTSVDYIHRYKYGLLIDERIIKPEEAAKRIDILLHDFTDVIPYSEIGKEFWINTPQAVVDVINDVLNN